VNTFWQNGAVQRDRIDVGFAAQATDRLVVPVDADPQVADTVQRIDVVGVVLEQAFVFLDRRFDLPLRDELLRALEQQLNDQLAAQGRRVTAARIEQGVLVVTIEG
jgi:hypothetical protein